MPKTIDKNDWRSAKRLDIEARIGVTIARFIIDADSYSHKHQNEINTLSAI